MDVITADNLAALRTYRDAIWYPATVPPNYRTRNSVPPRTLSGRVAATDSSLAANPIPGLVHRHVAVETASTYQQVFVVVNQTWSSSVGRRRRRVGCRSAPP